MREVNIGPASEFADPGRKLVGFERFEVAVFKIGGEFHAYLNPVSYTHLTLPTIYSV